MDTPDTIISFEKHSTYFNWLKRLFGRAKADSVYVPENIADAQCLFSSLQESNAVFRFETPDSSAPTSKLVYGYLALFSVLTLSPLVTWAVMSWKEPSRFMEGMREVQNYTATLISSLSGLSGLIGFVIGRHFSSKNVNNWY